MQLPRVILQLYTKITLLQNSPWRMDWDALHRHDNLLHLPEQEGASVERDVTEANLYSSSLSLSARTPAAGRHLHIHQCK